MKRFTSLHIIVPVLVALVATACASIGRPEGGPKDVTPPVFVSSNPETGAKNFSKNKLDIYFNENVQVADASTKLVVSPPQKQPPKAFANGRHVTVELQDTLLPNTTYTIDFGDAIKDLNEGNILDGFATYFSTGDTIDTLRISGMVLEARTLEPAQGIIVGVYSNMSDTALTTLPFERIARTNQLGQFTIHNLKATDYRIFALNDVDNNYKWGRTEDIAFYDTVIRPYAETIEVTDTLRSSTGEDSLRVRQGTAFFPNDILLTWFNEGFARQYMADKKRPDRRRITINMGTAADTLPEITIAKGEHEGRNINDWALLKKNATLDTLEYWIKDPDILAIDSLTLSVRYQATDTADMLSWRTDTIKFFYHDPKQPKKKKKKDEEADTLPPPIDFLKFSPSTGTSHEVYMPVVLASDQPIDSIDPAGVHLEVQQDTLWLPIADATLVPDSLNPLLSRRLYHKWDYGTRYRLTVDSAAVTGIYGNWNNTLKHEFSVKKEEDYSNLMLNVTPTDSVPMFVEILDKSDKVLRSEPVVDGTATFTNMTPNTYYARLYIDSNANGKWDTGNVADSIQPEQVYYFPKKIALRKNWDVAQSWDIYATPLDAQKPNDIKKNKPKLKKGENNRYQDEEEEDEYGEDNNVFGDYNSTYNNARRNTGNGRGSGSMRGNPGF